VAQLLRGREVEVAPRAGLGLVAELLERVGLQVARGLAAGIGEDDVVDDLGHPAVVAQLERAARLLERRVGAAHELDVALRRLRRRVGVQRCRVAVEPAQVVDVGGLDVVVERPVVAAHRPVVRQRGRESDLLGDLARRQAVVGQTQRLVVDEAVAVAAHAQHFEHVLPAPRGPVVHAVHDLDAVAPEVDRLLEVLRPG
jgi:hypothetical protein